MNREDLRELHYIAHMSNVASILTHGILSHNAAKAHQHKSVASAEVQLRRKIVKVPGGLALHDYVNLYICARNPMLYVLSDKHESLCVLRISPDVLDLPEVVVTDRNAARGQVRFAEAPEGLSIVDKVLTFAQYWTSDDPIEAYQKKGAKCAEVLVPSCIPPEYIVGAYVSCRKTLAKIKKIDTGIEVTVYSYMFFR